MDWTLDYTMDWNTVHAHYYIIGSALALCYWIALSHSYNYPLVHHTPHNYSGVARARAAQL